MANENNQFNILFWAASQVNIYEKRARSQIEKQYGETMRKSAIALVDFIPRATFDELLSIEKTFQQNDLTVYAQHPATIKTVEQGIRDFNDAEAVYKQLLANPQAYYEHKYRESERASPDKLVPLDAMRRALRGQVKRVENYSRNVMGNPQEQTFLSARTALLHRAEDLYDEMQRVRLPQSSPESAP
jgi:hypothetical protein